MFDGSMHAAFDAQMLILIILSAGVLMLCYVLQTLTTAVSSWQAAENEASGINPLMQTPAPASTTVFALPGADSEGERTAQAVLRKQRISPKKLNEFARLIRRKHIDDALVQCQVAPNKAAKLCYKVYEKTAFVLVCLFYVVCLLG